MRILVTGSDGFIGKNLIVRLHEKKIEYFSFTRGMTIEQLAELANRADFIFHLAGVNRPNEAVEFKQGNADLTKQLCHIVRARARPIPILYTSSIQAELENPYGSSKFAAEQALLSLHADTGSSIYIYRLPNVFGKWSRPNYNSVVATFCHNIANRFPIQINDSHAVVRLVYIDDVINSFISTMLEKSEGTHCFSVTPEYNISIGELANQIYDFSNSRNTMIVETVGTGLTRALYATYLSFLKPAQFSYSVPTHIDPRGRFVEMLKTKSSGQFSFFTAHPGITRGGHYHHTKNEKFLVIQGQARFGFQHVVTGETYELFTEDNKLQIVETIPGWAHDITNIGNNEMIVLLWANEIFDKQKPDTISYNL